MRNRAARDRAEEALIRFALLAGRHTADFVVIGGLNPDFLAPGAPHPHLGTTDVDLLFEIGFSYDRDDLDFGWLDQALDEGGFEPFGGSGWRWRGQLGDALVTLDLLCDVYDHPGQPIALPGARAAAQNVRGPAAALYWPITRELEVSAELAKESPGAPSSVRMRFASLGGYIAAKASALLSRDAVKDAYDLAFVIMYGAGGPDEAAESARMPDLPPHVDRVEPRIAEAVALIADAESARVLSVAGELQRAGDEAETAVLCQDIAQSAQRFLRAYLS